MGFILKMTQVIACLHLHSDAQCIAPQVTPGVRKAAMNAVLQGCNRLHNELDRIDIARIAHPKLTTILCKGLNHGVEFFFFFALKFPISVGRETKRVFPF